MNGVKVDIIIVLVLLGLTLAESNHQIKFDGMANGYHNLTVAGQALRDNLKYLTGHEIVIDSISEGNAVWHSDNLTKLGPECPEAGILGILDLIKRNPKGYTREFKMYLTEHFEVPRTVSIEWLGSCENVARKRSDPLGSDGGIPSTASSETTEEPQDPLTTIETTNSSPGVETITVLESTEPTITTTVEDPSISRMPLEQLDPKESAAMTTTTTTTTITTTVEPLTTESSGKSLFSRISILDFDAPFVMPNLTDDNSTERSSSRLDLGSFAIQTPTPTSQEESTTLSNPIEESVSSSEPPNLKLNSESSKNDTTQSPDSSELGYGKFIGLALAFLTFVAYLICSRSYSRQGMYELHNE